MKWYRLYFKILLSLLMLSGSGTLVALPSSLYQGQVPVASHAPADWDKAVAPALAQVLIKISGNRNITDIDVIKQGLTKADGYVQSYNYVTGTAPAALSLQIRFSPKAVNNLLQNANQGQAPQSPQVPTSEHHSLTLVWLAVQDAQGQPQLLTDAKDATVAGVQQQADKSGLSLLWPAGDLEDISSLSANQVWQLDQGAVQQASHRYQADNILLGKIQKQPDGSWQGDWVMINNQGNVSWQTQGNNTGQAAVAVLAKLGGSLKDVSAVTPGVVSGQVDLTVLGINGLNDYAALVNYLRSLASVANVDTRQMGGNSITLSVALRASQSALVNEISQGDKLTAANSQNPAMLTYHWAGADNTRGLSPVSSAAPAIITSGTANAQSYPVTDTPAQFNSNASPSVPEEVSP